jgi:hypothetical protein
MRRLVIPLICVAISASAFCAEKGQVEVKADYLRPYVVSTDNAQTAKSSVLPPLIKRDYSPTDTICYTMRSMLVQKEPGTDATEVVGQRTCTPSSKFQMKHSVQQAK